MQLVVFLVICMLNLYFWSVRKLFCLIFSLGWEAEHIFLWLPRKAFGLLEKGVGWQRMPILIKFEIELLPFSSFSFEASEAFDSRTQLSVYSSSQPLYRMIPCQRRAIAPDIFAIQIWKLPDKKLFPCALLHLPAVSCFIVVGVDSLNYFQNLLYYLLVFAS